MKGILRFIIMVLIVALCCSRVVGQATPPVPNLSATPCDVSNQFTSLTPQTVSINGINTTLSFTDGINFQSAAYNYNLCGLNVKAGNWLGAGYPGLSSVKLNSSAVISNLILYFSAFDGTEQVTITATKNGVTVPITLSFTTQVNNCNSSFSISGNQLSNVGNSLNFGVVITGAYYDALFISHNGASNGSHIAVCYSQASIECPANVAPSLSSTNKNNICPSTTIDLSTITASNSPANTVLSWHTGTPATNTNKLSSVTSLAAGTYYAAFYNSTNSCYGPTTILTATTNICSAGTIDCSKTQIYPAPIVGTPQQRTMLVTLNVTTAGCFTPLSITGSGFSLSNDVSQLCATSTGVQQLVLPVNYNGSTLSNVNFTIGSAGSCTADLTKSPKKAIVDMWTLDCIPTQGPSLK